MRVPALCYFTIFGAPTAYDDLKTAVKEFESGTKEFSSAVAYLDEGSSLWNTTPSPKTTNVRPDSRVHSVPSKVDNRAAKFAGLSLIVKKSNENKNEDSDADAETEKNCSYCNEFGHYGNRCPDNPLRIFVAQTVGRWATKLAHVGRKGRPKKQMSQLRKPKKKMIGTWTMGLISFGSSWTMEKKEVWIQLIRLRTWRY